MAQAPFGAEYTQFAPFAAAETADAAPTYGEVISLGGLVSITETPNVASGTLDSDNKETLRKDSIMSYTLAITTDGIPNKDAAVLYGAAFDEDTGDLGRDPDDNAPYGGYGYIRNIATEDNEYYKAIFYPKTKAAPSADGANTKASGGITYNTTNLSLTAQKTKNKETKLRTDSDNFETLDEAIAWLAEKFGKPPIEPIEP